FSDCCCPVPEQKKSQYREDYGDSCHHQNRFLNTLSAADHAAERIHRISKRHQTVNLRYKRRGDLHRISSCRSCQLNHHKYQHQKTSHFAQEYIEEVHNGGERHRSQAGKSNGLAHLYRGKSVENVKQQNDQCSLQKSQYSKNRRLACPPCSPGFQFSFVCSQRV